MSEIDPPKTNPKKVEKHPSSPWTAKLIFLELFQDVENIECIALVTRSPKGNYHVGMSDNTEPETLVVMGEFLKNYGMQELEPFSSDDDGEDDGAA